MITVHRAVYGTSDGGHALLASDLPSHALPSGLAGLVDRPPGTYTPAVRWSPFVACIPIGEWWALWRTIEDVRGIRAGTVQSHVALVPLKQVAHLPNLAPLLNKLPREVIPPPLTCSAFSVDETAVSHDQATLSQAYLSLVTLLVSPRQQPVIYPDEGDFEEVLCTLWRHLWPEARKRLSCQMVFSPGAITGAGPEVIVTTPAALASRWEGYPLVNRGALQAPSGIASLLYGTPAPSFLALRARLDELPGDLRRLVWFERAAETIGTRTLSQLSLEELRTVRECVAELAPLPATATGLKAELIQSLCTALPQSTLKDVRALANVSWGAFDKAEAQIREALALWCNQALPSLGFDELLVLVKRVADLKYQGWWRETIQQGLIHCLRTGIPNIYGAIWHWWGKEHAAAWWLAEFLEGAQQEEELLLRTCPAALSGEKVEAALHLAALTGWPKLHARVVASAFPPAAAVRRQLAFPHPSQAGWRILGEHLPVHALVQEAVASKQPELLGLATDAVVKHPELLADLDPADVGWRALWLMVAREGASLATNVELPRLLPRLIEALLKGEQVEPELLSLIAQEPEAHLLDQPRRQEVWALLPPSALRSWQKSTAAAWVKVMQEQQIGERPEPMLVSAVLEQITEDLDRGRLAAQELLRCLQLFPELREERVTTWFARLVQDRKFPEWLAPAFGKICLDRHWKQMADEALDLFKRGYRQVEAMLEQCRSLLSFWSQLVLPSFSANISSYEFFRALEEVVIRLYPDGPKQKDLWERAGGSLQDLPGGDTGGERWHKALDAAQKGVRLDKGIRGLLQEMLQDFPNNHQLKTLLSITPQVRR